MQARLTDFRELTAREITGFDCSTSVLSFCRDVVLTLSISNGRRNETYFLYDFKNE